ncbi:nucleoid-associated protein YejK [Halomonas campisalis]|uniref:Nucleoid-associated protein YejK n=1 Tax=Billgrantia campisalis TaxID=74661 RepID=A0ABS9P831_9GAMM|nr:nucleoid-associated protein YejK [Halomonas campisalis]MCG6657928.1 nucleoid-associated protein YejK [Halomonas campisalis]MDR5863547.1 nucleoid-associated protein YejK [Halomonas campisalis]
MPILHSIVHRIDKEAVERPATLSLAEAELTDSEPLDSLVTRLHDTLNAKPKGWGYFAEADGEGEPAAGLAGELDDYLAQRCDFTDFTHRLAQRLLEVVDAHLSVSGHLLVAHTRQGDTQYLSLALLHHRSGFQIDTALKVTPAFQLNLTQLSLALRINLSQWQGEAPSLQYITFLRDRGGRKLADDLAACLGIAEGVDAPGETRTLLKAFSDYVAHEDLAEEQSREKTEALIDYASEQASRGEPMTLEALSEVLDEQQPKAFYEHIRNADYGLSPEIPPDKRTLNQFRRFTGRAGGVSISFDSHLLGSSIEYDESQDRLIIKQVPKQLREQLKRRQE